MFDPGIGRLSMGRGTISDDHDVRLPALLYRVLMRWGPRRLSRDITLVHDQLIREGRADWLGQSGSAGAPLPLQDIDRAVARVRALLAGAG
jgi:hypothetical protein